MQSELIIDKQRVEANKQNPEIDRPALCLLGGCVV